MEKRAEKRRGGYTVGTSLVLVTFVLLALFVFAILSFTHTNADYRLSVNAMENTTAYYEAYANAQVRLAEISDIIIKTKEDSENETEFEDKLVKAIEQTFDKASVTVSKNDDGCYLSYCEKISENRNLDFEIRVCGVNESDVYTVSKCMTSPVNDEETEEKLNLMF